MAIKARYKGKGDEFLEGIPARSLDDEEFEALDADQRKLVRASDLYDVATEPRSSSAPSAPDKRGGGD